MKINVRGTREEKPYFLEHRRARLTMDKAGGGSGFSLAGRSCQTEGYSRVA